MMLVGPATRVAAAPARELMLMMLAWWPLLQLTKSWLRLVMLDSGP